MRLDVFADPVEFLEAATEWLMLKEAENNLILGLAARAAAEAPVDPWFALVRDGDSGIACAWQTIPSTVGITRVGDERGIPLLAGVIAPRLSGGERLVGPEPEIGHLAQQVAGLLGLYTDLANPTSNSIYRKIGYRGICDTGVYRLGA